MKIMFGLPPGVEVQPGYIGVFTRAQGLDCWPNGSRVIKNGSDPGKADATPNGTLGSVLGSLSHPVIGKLYFVEWDDKPKIAIGCALVSAMEGMGL